jgi:hypothetical protein
VKNRVVSARGFLLILIGCPSRRSRPLLLLLRQPQLLWL